MREFIKNVFETSSDRIKNPLVGSYIITFLIYNWKPISIYLFSNSNIEGKIKIINPYLGLHSIFWPMGIALFYVIAIPYFNLIIDNILERAENKKTAKIKALKVENLNLKVIEAQLERKIADERAGTSEIDNLKNKIDGLEAENEIKSQEIIDARNRWNIELTGVHSRYDSLLDDKNDLETKYNHLIESSSRKIKVHDLLINQKVTADRDIKLFLRTDLDNSDVIDLRKYAEEEKDSIYITLPFTTDIIALLLKAKVFVTDEKNRYVITEMGRKFIKELD